MRYTAKLTGMALLAAGLLYNSLLPLAQAADDDKDAKKSDKPSAGAKTAVAVFRLRGEIVETPGEAGFLFGVSHNVSLKDLVTRLTKAADDDAIKAVVLSLEGAHPSTSQTEELRQALARLREKGKKVYAHADELTMGDYALLAGVDRLSLVPTGDLWLTGL